MFIIFILVIIIKVSSFYIFLKNSHYFYLFVWMHVSVCTHGEGIGSPGAGITGRCELPDAGTGNLARALSVLIS